MASKHLLLFLKLYFRPASAMSSIIDEGRWLYGAAFVLVVSFLFSSTVTDRLYKTYEAVPIPEEQLRQIYESDDEEFVDIQIPPEYLVTRKPLPAVGDAGWYFLSFSRFNVMATVVTLSIFYVPAVILAVVLISPVGSFGVALRRDYGPMLACTLMGWAAAHLPFALAGIALDRFALPQYVPLLMWAAAKLVFAIYMIVALRTVFGTSFAQNAGAVSLSSLSGAVETFILGSRMLWYLASPWVLFILYALFRSRFGDIDSAFRGRQNFRRSLEASTINPRNAEAHYQLGLIYQQRRQYTEAANRFKKAIEIDAEETDAHFQLGRMAREQGRLQEAIDYFNTVVSQNDNHAHGEIWREIGAAYTDASMFDEAHEALVTYLDRRPFDPEGLYLMAYTLGKLGRKDEARDMLERCLEAVRTMPFYRRGIARKWGKLAEKQLREIGPQGV
jgi:tetratricopeptide (TPR) repeat protein